MVKTCTRRKHQFSRDTKKRHPSFHIGGTSYKRKRHVLKPFFSQQKGTHPLLLVGPTKCLTYTQDHDDEEIRANGPRILSSRKRVAHTARAHTAQADRAQERSERMGRADRPCGPFPRTCRPARLRGLPARPAPPGLSPTPPSPPPTKKKCQTPCS